jgi:putative endonuclease
MHCVYILFSHKLDKFYVGRTEDLTLRLAFHNNPIEARKFTARGIPWTLRLSIPCQTKNQSIRLEKLIKGRKSRKFIEALVTDKLLVLELLKNTSSIIAD